MRRETEKTVRFLLGVLLFAALAAVMCVCFFSAGGGMAAAIVLIVSYAVSLILIPALHEGGHLLCGKLAGFRLLEVRFCFVRIVRTGAKLSVTFVNPLQSETVGCCRMYPTKIAGMGGRFTLFIAGGVLAQAVWIAVSLSLCFAFRHVLLWATLGVSAVYCAYLFCLNLLPVSGGEGEFDGALLWGMLRKDLSARVSVALLTAQGQIYEGRSPGETDERIFSDLPQLPEDDPNFARLQYFRFARHLDRGEREQAVRAITRLESCLEYILPDVLAAVYCELTYTYAFLLRDRQQAERYHARMEWGQEPENAAAALRARLAYALLAGEEERAAVLAVQAQSAVSREPLEGMRRYEEKLLQELRGG